MTASPTENTEELPEAIERFLRFNCPNSCDGNGTYTEMDSDGDPEPAQCQWCFEFGMPAREAIKAYSDQAVQAFGEKVLAHEICQYPNIQRQDLEAVITSLMKAEDERRVSS